MYFLENEFVTGIERFSFHPLTYFSQELAENPVNPSLYDQAGNLNYWPEIMQKYFFVLADSFALSQVLEPSDLYTPEFFADWEIEVAHELLETPDESVVTTFFLNESCKSKLLHHDDYPYQRSKDGNGFDEYYETTYFYQGVTCIGYTLLHENMIDFLDVFENTKYLRDLPIEVKNHLCSY